MHLNTKSEYSFLNSVIKLDEYLAFAHEHNLTALSICDVNSTWGINKFISKCKKENIKPVVGIEVELNHKSWYYFAKNNQGIKRLNQILTTVLGEKVIKLNPKEPDLIFVISDLALITKLAQATPSEVENFKQKFAHVFLGYNDEISKSKDYNLLVSKNYFDLVDIQSKNYLEEEDNLAFRTLGAIKNNQRVINDQRHDNCFSQPPAANTVSIEQIANLCEYQIEKTGGILPYPYLNKDMSDDHYLELLATKGLLKRLGDKDKTIYQERLKKELTVIRDLGFSSYFLIVWDIVKYARQQNILVGPARGSAGGCLVSYCLGITNIDPVAHDLIFERFLNPMRKSMPDIDIDFEDSRRGEIIEYIGQRFGEENVCQIGTLQRFLAKRSFRDVAKAHGVDSKIIDQISKLIKSNLSFGENVEQNQTLKSECEKKENSFLKEIMPVVEKIEGLPRQSSVHAAGVIIANHPVTTYAAKNEDNVCLLEAKELEEMGLLKLDILALSNLTFIKEIVEEIKIQDSNFDINSIPLNDEQTYELLTRADTLGVFQVESRGMREALKEVRPTCFDEIALVIALYRPGPKEYIKKYQQLKKTFVANNEVDELLKSTYGILVYQEQVMQIAQLVAGYDLAKADILRRSISKRNQELLESIRTDFITSAVKNGYAHEYSEKLFNQIAKFAGYGFNKAHAYGYAMIVYQMAYLKAHYPLIFYAKLFYYNFKSADRDEFLNELSNNKIEIIPPDIRYSQEDVTIVEGKLRLGLGYVKGIGRETIHQIIRARQKLTLPITMSSLTTELIMPAKLSKTQVKSLVHAGAFDFLGLNRHSLEENLTKFSSQQTLNIFSYGGEMQVDHVDEYKLGELAKKEYEMLSINLKYDIFQALVTKANQRKKLPAKLLKNVNLHINQEVITVIRVNQFKEITTKTGQQMCFLQASAPQIYEIVVFSDEFYKYSAKLYNSIDNYLLVRIKIKDENLQLKEIYE